MTIRKTLIATALLAMAQPALAQDSDDSIEISFKGDTVAGEPVIYQRHQERMSQGVESLDDHLSLHTLLKKTNNNI